MKSVSNTQEDITKQQFRTFLNCRETSKLKTETFSLLKETLIWSKIYRVANDSVNMGVVEI